MLNNKHHILILQHPQEPGHPLGSAPLAHQLLKNSTLRVGLSWPNLTKALGNNTKGKDAATKDIEYREWAVLYLGSGIKTASPTQPAKNLNLSRQPNPLQFVTRKGIPCHPPKGGLKGIVVLDGTWSQAKSLWWRNPWLLKLNRAILTPSHPSLYQGRRREPRRECLSTIESIAETLVALGEPSEIADQLRTEFERFLKRK